MSDTLWAREPHTAAKHQVLRAYLDGWLGVMANQALKVQRLDAGRPRLLLLDGFAGPGRYAGGEEGSPLIMLDALLSHAHFGAWEGVDFEFLFIEHDESRVEHLRKEIEQIGSLPNNVITRTEHGEFEKVYDTLVDPLIQAGLPTFAFIDPFGYSSASMSITGRLLDFPRCEVLYFLPMSFIHRFVGRPGQEKALGSLFGTEGWQAAIDLEGPERTDFLLDLFERQLAANGGVEFVRSFQLRTLDGNDYRLVFSLGHTKGLELAKDAMWKVDPVAGTSYRAETESGQEVLFDSTAVDTAPLLKELRNKFGTSQFTIDQADRVTLVDTPFRKAHLRKLTLQPAERAGHLEVQRTGPRGFKNAKLRFTS
ncbi:MAG TPA: three-Cys-motif partner protein TcmP [Solirubrobacterales bacterium]|nr:three-Cys-motif partner protein TcmP [Solirubrobacterales bacterium]